MTQKVVNNDEAVTGSTIFFAIFGTFGRYVTNLSGTFVENVKNVKNQPSLPPTHTHNKKTKYLSHLHQFMNAQMKNASNSFVKSCTYFSNTEKNVFRAVITS
jgi:hypothetical protein